MNWLARTCFRIFMSFKRLASILLALICEYLRVQSSNTVLLLKLTCSTLQSAVILDSSIILIRISLQTSLWNLCSLKLTSLCEGAKHLEARHRGAVVTFKYIYYKTSVQLWWLYIPVFFTITIKLSLCISVSCTHSYTQLKQRLHKFFVAVPSDSSSGPRDGF